MPSMQYLYSHNSLSPTQFLIATGIGIIIGLIVVIIINKKIQKRFKTSSFSCGGARVKTPIKPPGHRAASTRAEAAFHDSHPIWPFFPEHRPYAAGRQIPEIYGAAAWILS